MTPTVHQKQCSFAQLCKRTIFFNNQQPLRCSRGFYEHCCISRVISFARKFLKLRKNVHTRCESHHCDFGFILAAEFLSSGFCDRPFAHHFNVVWYEKMAPALKCSSTWRHTYQSPTMRRWHVLPGGGTPPSQRPGHHPCGCSAPIASLDCDRRPPCSFARFLLPFAVIVCFGSGDGNLSRENSHWDKFCREDFWANA